MLLYSVVAGIILEKNQDTSLSACVCGDSIFLLFKTLFYKMNRLCIDSKLVLIFKVKCKTSNKFYSCGSWLDIYP